MEIYQRRFDYSWQLLLESILLDTSLETVQCLILAQLYCFLVSDDERLAQYNSICVGAALRLGLYKTQKSTTSDTLDGEMKRKLFWCVYCLDRYGVSLWRNVNYTANNVVLVISAFLQLCLAYHDSSRTKMYPLSIHLILMKNILMNRVSYLYLPVTLA